MINNPDHPVEIMTGVIHSIADQDPAPSAAIAWRYSSGLPSLQVRVRYRPYVRDTVPYSMAGQAGLVPGRLSPWVVVPTSDSSSIIVGQEWTLHAGDLVIEIEAPDPGVTRHP